MALPGIIRRLTYNPWFIRAVRTLGLRAPARRIYHYLASSRQGVLELERGGVSARFFTRTPEQLRAIEAGSMEPSLDLILRFLKPGDTVYDIGSHLGVYTVLLARVVGETGTVVAWEPHQETYEHLQENLKLNGLTNVRAFQKAVGERDAQEKLYIGQVVANFSLLSGAITNPPGHGEIPYQLVQVVEGDPFAKAEGLPIPSAVKIDVEGFEYAVIKGFRRTLSDPKCRMVCLEVHPKSLPPGVKVSDITDLLKSLGYERLDAEPAEIPYPLIANKR
ncbi:MAG: FkbM family methyltransferase [Terriglobia bacterium]|jgi:FkbM family methyltransferase